ncbi:hypothetical protein CK203_101329 [Vitis vinifera]|uniref:Retrotransposon gag domain-containing protein n=1 Tax=Vitis vinifera TaxID=29760 RepID=A0A438C5T8_VITVI|nr:hypothetical protein CK203_101329 [Vitis vinifera]
MHPPRMSAPSCIVPPIEQLVIRPHIVPLLPTFHGWKVRIPTHIKEFEEDQWLEKEISNFSAKENEKFYECWERYMEAINACPHHGFDTWLLVSYFYDAEVSRGWDEPNAREVGRMKLNLMLLMLRLDNPKGIHEVEAQEGESSLVREVKAVITLRSGKEVDLPTSKPEHEPEMQVSSEIQRSGLSYHLSDDWRDVCGESFVGLGASVNLLPYSIYKQLGLGELKLTSITLSLADRSVKIPRGMIEDVLVQVDKFYYSMDFVVLDMDPEWSHATYIWQHDVRTQHLLYVLELIPSGRRRRTRRGVHDSNLVEEHCDKKILEDLNESLGNLDEGLPEPSYLLATLPPLKMRKKISLYSMRRRHKKLFLKPLPMELKYAYLEENKQSPVVISLALTTTQADCLLEILRNARKR